MSDSAPSVSSEGTHPPADSKLICKKCKASFPSGNALHKHIPSCGTPPSAPDHHCRCAAVETELKTELQEIKALLADVLASKPKPELNPSFQPFKELKQLEQESPLDFARRCREEFLKLPVAIQYQRNTRYHLYEHIRASTPKIYSGRRRFYDGRTDIFDVFDYWEDDIKEEREEKRPKQPRKPGFSGPGGNSWW